jgi:Tetratricopeptide repeat
LVEALREEPLDPARIQRAYLRFRQRASAHPRRPGLRIARWAAAALMVGVSSVYAASLIRPFASAPEASVSPPPPVPTTSSKPRAKTSPKPPALPTETPPPPVEASPEIEEERTAAPRERPTRRLAAAPAPSAEHWKRAAQGLRDGDFQGANAALKELTRSGTEGDREAALLVRAQVLLAQGRESEARGVLQSLEATAHAPSVRRKSAELLARLRDRAAQSGSKARVTERP